MKDYIYVGDKINSQNGFFVYGKSYKFPDWHTDIRKDINFVTPEEWRELQLNKIINDKKHTDFNNKLKI